jgi:hypothetical protein
MSRLAHAAKLNEACRPSFAMGVMILVDENDRLLTIGPSQNEPFGSF